MQARGLNVPLIRFLISDIYCLLVYIVCFPIYPFFLHLFLTYPPLLIFSFENRPAPFTLAAIKFHKFLVFIFCVVVHVF